MILVLERIETFKRYITLAPAAFRLENPEGTGGLGDSLPF